MIYFDSNIFIYVLIYEENTKKVKKADYYLTQLVKGEITGYTCTLTWDEVFYIILRVAGIDKAIKSGDFLLNFPNLIFLDVDIELILAAHEIVRKAKIMPRDAIHAASAIKHCSGEIISSDSDFDNVKGITRTF